MVNYSNRSEVNRFIKNTNSKDQFFEYIFIASGKLFGVQGNKPPVMKNREEFKNDEARYMEKAIG